MPFGTTAGDSLLFETGSGVYTRIPGVQNLTFSGGERETIDASELFSTAPVSYPGFPTPRTAQFLCWYDPADTTQAALFTSETAQTDKGYRYVMNGTAERLAFTGKISSIQRSLEKNAMRQFTVTIALTSGITEEANP